MPGQPTSQAEPMPMSVDQTGSREQNTLSRGFFTRTHLETQAMLEIEAAAHQRYAKPASAVPPDAPAPAQTPAEAAKTEQRRLARLLLPNAAGRLPSPPSSRKWPTVGSAVPVRSAKRANAATAPASSPSAPAAADSSAKLQQPAQHGSHERMDVLTSKHTIATTWPSMQDRVGQLYQPLAVVRTPYQEKAMLQSRDPTVHPPAVYPAAAATPHRSLFALEDFDDGGDEASAPPPSERLRTAAGDHRDGIPAHSRYRDVASGAARWMPCTVVAHDAATRCYCIRWPDGKTKWTRRLNFVCDDEDLRRWVERVGRAVLYRDRTEAALRLMLYLQTIPDDVACPFDEDRLNYMLSLVAKEFPVAHLHVLEQCTQEVERLYYLGVKRAVHLYNMKDPREQARLAGCYLPRPKPQPITSLRGLRGTIDTPSPNFSVARGFIAENLFQSHLLLQETLHDVHVLWLEYAPRTLCRCTFDEEEERPSSHKSSGGGSTAATASLPLQLRDFEYIQASTGAALAEKLRADWSATVYSTVRNNLDAYFNFYESNRARYEVSRMRRFIALVTVMMNSELRQLLTHSLEAYASLMLRYDVRVDAAAEHVLPCLPEDAAEDLFWSRREGAHGGPRGDGEVASSSPHADNKATAEGREASGAGEPKPQRADGAADGDDAAASPINASPPARSPVDRDAHGTTPLLPARITATAVGPFTQRVVDLTMRVNDLRPLFYLTLVVMDDGRVTLDPSLEATETVVRNVFESCIQHGGSISAIEGRLLPLLELPETHLRPLDPSEPMVHAARAQVEQVLRNNRDAPRQLRQAYSVFEYILQTPTAVLVSGVEELERPLEDMDSALLRLARDVERIAQRTPNRVKYELYTVDCKDLKTKLIAKAEELMAAVMDTLARQLSERCMLVAHEYEGLVARMTQEPATPEELQELRAFIDQVPEKEAALQARFSAVTAGNELLLRYGYLVTHDGFERYWAAYEWPRRLQQLVEDRSFRCTEYRTAFVQSLRAQGEQLSFGLVQLAAQVEDFTHSSDEARADEFYERAKEIEASIRTCQADVTLLNRREGVFGLTVTQFPQLKEVKQLFAPFLTVWEVASTSSAEMERWMNARLADLQPTEVEQKVLDWSKRVAAVWRSVKGTEAGEVVQHLRESIDGFRPNIPLLYALRSNLQAIHWRAIYQQCGTPREKQGFGPGGVDNNDTQPFINFVRLGMLDFMPQIEAVAAVAQRTYELESDLMSMTGDWKKLMLELEPYQDTYKLKANDAMLLVLDEHALKTQSMLGKPIVRQVPALQARVAQWGQQLDNVQDTMDEWFRCQGTWAYLEPIFSSADISRSLPAEKAFFVAIDESWREIMEHTRAVPQVLTRCQEESLLRTLRESNTTLDAILKKLQMFLETKRMAFPRFFFISNEELLQILSDSRDPYLVQPYLAKCFEGIKRIRFADHHDIIGLESPEAEYVPLTRVVNPGDHGNQVELWLQAVETSMKDAVREQLRQAIIDYPQVARTTFIRRWPGQVVIAVCALFWSMEATQAMLDDGAVGLSAYHEKCTSQLDELILLVRDSGLSVVERCTLEALVVIEVHAKDIIQDLAAKAVDSPNSFDWQSQLRYAWQDDQLYVQQINATLRYGYEYLGNTSRLVITPLTDRCYRTLIGALHMNYGGAPEGPAGTGKTETTKDLAKALGKYCVVYNCSDQISARDMAKLFKGLTQTGAWGCFDEFNRIELQVLSVIAQQIATIQEAIIQRRSEFLFEGHQIRMDAGCAIFITMNPGYAGRAELPDNLKALFRPVAMMVPNYAMIGEIQLYSYGFLHGKVLAEKIVATYRLCSEQLSLQDHYDYGMRAVKAVLTAAGRLKHAYPEEDEAILMLRSIQDVNLPKFLSQDIELFNGIVSDLFPGVSLPEADYSDMHRALTAVCARRNVQLTPYFATKVQQTYEMICVRHGMMIVGHSYGGKTEAIHCLAEALGLMQAEQKELQTHVVTIHPKSITMAQLYGKVEQSGEWTDGVLSNRFRQLAQDTSPDRQWLVLDGPVDAAWIENMNTVLDDNKKLCLQNGDIISVSKTMNLIFEVQDLLFASPATVSRCGMVYVEPKALGWRCLIDSYMNTLPAYIANSEPLRAATRQLADTFLEELLTVVAKQMTTVVPQDSSTAVASFIRLFASFVNHFDEAAAAAAAGTAGDPAAHAQMMLQRVEGWFLFSLVWSIGGCLSAKDRELFSRALHASISAKSASYRFTLRLPEPTTSFYDVKLSDEAEVRFNGWFESVPELTLGAGVEYQDIIVPTAETTTYMFLVRQMIASVQPALLVGDTGTGKTVMLKSILQSLPKEDYRLQSVQLSAQTSAAHLQQLIDSSCERRRKGVFGPPINQKMVVFIDDVNLPQLEVYGAQPPIELLRQLLGQGGWYNFSKEGLSFHHMLDILLLCAMGPPGGGRNPITPRFTRYFNTFSVPSFGEDTLKKIFGTLMDWILAGGFAPSLRVLGAAVVDATVGLYGSLVEQMKPSPEKSHYTFNLRDVSRVFHGIHMAFPPRIDSGVALAELWAHEVARAFADRFTDDRDTAWFNEELRAVANKHLKVAVPTSGPGSAGSDGISNLFCSFTNNEGNYEKVPNAAAVREALEERLIARNAEAGGGDLDLVIFDYVVEHVARISRVLRQPGGSLMLIGIGGSGRRSCTKLAAYIEGCDYQTITVAKEYDDSDFLDDIRRLLLRTGQKGYTTAFVLSDTQITNETFLEDLCSLLNTGEVPGLWGAKQDREVYENATASLRDVGKALDRPDTAEALQALFVERCRKHLHIVLCFSPLGRQLRDRLRRFPSLVNCTTIDYFHEWPEDGLRSVARHCLGEVELTEAERGTIEALFVRFQQQVREMSAVFLAETGQQTYVTPTSYLVLLFTFARMLKERRETLTQRRQRYTNGLAQLKQTEDQVEVMQGELGEMQPALVQKQKEIQALIEQVEAESKSAEAHRAVVAVDEAAANTQAAAAKKIKDASQEKVDAAQPLVLQAQRAVQDLDPKALQEVKALKTPPQGVKYVVEVLCTLLGGPYKPKPSRDAMTGKVAVPYWEHAKTTLLTGDFKHILLNAYPDIVDHAPDAQINEVKKKMADEAFKMENIRKTSVALVGVATYIKAVVEYYKQNKVIKPLLAQAAAAQVEYDTAMTSLNKKKEELQVITDKLSAMQSHLNKVNEDQQALVEKVRDTDVRLTRARKLIEGLGGEKARFARESERYAQELDAVVANVVVSAGMVAYAGPFLHKYREALMLSWVQACQDSGLRVSADFSLLRFCGNPIDVLNWRLQQLPSDVFSLNSAVVMQNSSRWPLLVDPQQQANSWIRNMEREHDLVVVRPTEPDYIRAIRGAIAEGRPVLLENVEEEIDPLLENLLLRRLVKEGQMLVLHLGEPVEWNASFRLYLTTKLARPHYLPEVSTKVTIINFGITEQGLQDQLLQRVMTSERREVEEKKQALTLEAAANQASLKETEDRILSILSADGNILDSEAAIEELDSAKVQSDRIGKRQEEIDAMERVSDRVRNLFVPAAHLGASLFFCVTELAGIGPMYQHSLQSYISVFQEALARSEKAPEVEQRLENITSSFKRGLYLRICRSLFACDQLLFSFLMTIKITQVDPAVLRWFLLGGFETEQTFPPNPFSWLPEQSWVMVCRASAQLPIMRGLDKLVEEHELFFTEFCESSSPQSLELPGPLAELTPMGQMIVTRCFRMDKVVPAITAYVRQSLGDFFVEPPLSALDSVVDELAQDPAIPIILVLSPGADPQAELDHVAEQRGMGNNRLTKLSLGQGQDVAARALIDAGTRQGNWVLLQNCHLYADFMPALSRIIEDYSQVGKRETLNQSYRLWLTSLPSEVFPIAVLQSGVKLVQEPPRGLRSNLLQSYLSDPVADPAFFASCDKPETWQKLLFGVCFFHAVVQERRQYGPLGWNRAYEFNETDRRISVRQLNMLLNENTLVPYDALTYLIGECSYGGRVTDDWDRRCLIATLQGFLTPSILDDSHVFCEDAEEYYAPPFGEYSSYVEYIQSLPMEQPPEVFGLHENASITKDARDARLLLEATLTTQPRESAGDASANAMDPKAVVKQLAADVLLRLPDLFDIEAILQSHPIMYLQSMNTVLLQEANRFNGLLRVVRQSLVDVQAAIGGKVVMSAELEQVMGSLYDGKVPEMWRRRSYPSLKPFGAYVSDLLARLEFFAEWCAKGPPAVYWISGFFFTQSFLTGVMQNYARRHKVEIDKLTWAFEVMSGPAPDTPPEDGCYVNGLFLEGAGWDAEEGVLCESKPKELFIAFPTLRLTPTTPDALPHRPVYRCPCYKTTDRHGVLSTTGHSTNFIVAVDIPRSPDVDERHWILRGTALFTQLND